MSDIIHYLEPVESTWNPIYGISREESLGGGTLFFDGSINWLRETEPDIVIIGVPEAGNGMDNRHCSQSPDVIRKYLYGLRGFRRKKLIDAGNVKGNTVKDRYSALKDVTEWLLEKNKTVVVLGGTQDLTVPVYEALASVNEKVNITVCDAMIDLDVTENDFSSRAWINQLIDTDKELPEDLTLLGTQNYLVADRLENIIKNNFFDIIRLAEIKGDDLKKAEVPLRDSHLFSFDQRAVVGRHAFDENIASPHGLEPYEACKLCRYAGLSDKLSVMGLFETAVGNNPAGLNNAALSAQMVWHFIEGVFGRYFDYPLREISRYKNYIVFMDILEKDIRFYNNEDNGRWWMEIPVGEKRQQIFSCDYDDYLKAVNNELPDKWWRLFMKNREK